VRERDFHLFQAAGLADDYERIGQMHLFMRCDAANPAAFSELPVGYAVRKCKPNELEAWSQTATDPQYAKYALEFYDKVYAARADEFFRRCLFVCDADDRPVAASFIWRSYGCINTVGWTRVAPDHEDKGIGRALLTRLMRDTEYPVYLHTQPTSVRAIKLYADFGFKLIGGGAVGHRQNDLSESLPILEKVMRPADFAALQFVGEDYALHQAALTNVHAEF